MSFKKLVLVVVLIALSTSVLTAQVNFQQEFSFDKLNTTDNLRTLQLYDYDNNGIEDITAQYWDDTWDFWQMVIYNQSGDTLKTIHFDDWTYESYNRFSLYKSVDSNHLIRASLGYEPYKLHIYIHDCETLLLLDSLVIFPLHQDLFSGVNSADYYNNVSDTFLYIGALEIDWMREDEIKSHIYGLRITSDTLSYVDCLQYGGVSNTFYNDSTFLSIGEYSYVSVGAWPSGYFKYYLQWIPKDSISSAVQLHSTSGTAVWYDTTTTYNHCPRNYDMITQNCQDSSPQVLQYRKLDTDDGTSVHFKAYDTSDWQNIWSKTDTEIGMGDITASTCIEVNGEDNYVMYFRGSKLEIRDRITGNIIHHQDSVFVACDILRKSDGELLFFVEKQNGTGYDVYTLDGPIFVSTDEPHNQNDIIQQYPNPFRNSITFRFNLTTEHTERTEIRIYNIKGQLVRTLRFNASSLSRFVEISWDGKDNEKKVLSAGVYLYKFIGDEKTISGKILKIE